MRTKASDEQDPTTTDQLPPDVLAELDEQVEAYGAKLEERWLNTPGLWEEGGKGKNIFDIPAESRGDD